MLVALVLLLSWLEDDGRAGEALLPDDRQGCSSFKAQRTAFTSALRMSARKVVKEVRFGYQVCTCSKVGFLLYGRNLSNLQLHDAERRHEVLALCCGRHRFGHSQQRADKAWRPDTKENQRRKTTDSPAYRWCLTRHSESWLGLGSEAAAVARNPDRSSGPSAK